MKEEGEIIRYQGHWALAFTREKIVLHPSIQLPVEAEGFFTSEYIIERAGRNRMILEVSFIDDDGDRRNYRAAREIGSKGQSKRGGNSGRSNYSSSRAASHAPYNFIPLNRQVIEAPSRNVENKTLDGHIQWELKNLTPFFIRGRDHCGQEEHLTTSPFFFHIRRDEPMIPGSSLRGMIRNLFEIVTYSSMELVDRESILKKPGSKEKYKNSIEDHIRPFHDTIESPDYTQAVFGTTERAGRLFFEDADCTNRPERPHQGWSQMKPLMTPRPTSFQHYLEQPKGKDTPRNELRHWDSEDAPIRGYKQYWHKDGLSKDKWEAKNYPNTQGFNASSVYQPLSQVLQAEHEFRGKIRFEKLTSAELGALLFCLHLPEGCAYRLGQGKPYGLGSVIASVQGLTIIDRSKRYEAVFDADSWNLSEDQGKVKAHIDAFKTAMTEQLSQPYDWDIDARLKALKSMLEVARPKELSKEDWNNRTNYLPLDEFKERPVLADPGQTKDKSVSHLKSKEL